MIIHKKNVWILILIIIIVDALLFLLFTYVASPPSFEHIIQVEINRINKSKMKMESKGVRFDSAFALPKRSLQYNYTLVNCGKEDLLVAELKDTIELILRERIDLDTLLTPLKNEHTTFIYYFRDKYGDSLFKISIAPKCEQVPK